MFQRIKGAIDSRIAEEQARQKAAASTAPISRSASTAGRQSTSSRTESPARRARKPKPKEDDAAVIRGPDPSEFEGTFVIEDESEEPSRVGTPARMEDKKDGAALGRSPGDGIENGAEESENPVEAAPKPSVELPADVRTKLRKLEKLESRYQELLRSYRIAHARAILIDPFEKALKESTPLVSIGDPDALVEYLNQINLKGDMVMDELKRVSSDRDEYRKKFEVSEKEVLTVREELTTLLASKGKGGIEGSVTETEKADTISIDTPTASVKSPVSSVLAIFSPKQKPQSTDNKDLSEEFFSYDDEIPQLQSDVKAKTAEIEDLKSRVSTLQKDLAVAQETSANLVGNLEKATRDLNESKETFKLHETQHESLLLTQKDEIRDLKHKLETTKKQLASLEADIEGQKEAFEDKLKFQNDAWREADELRKKFELEVKGLQETNDSDKKQIQELSSKIESLNHTVEEPAAGPESGSTQGASTAAATYTAAKKKNKKKKKGGSASVAAKDSSVDLAEKSSESIPATPIVVTEDLQAEVSRLRSEVTTRDAQIEKLQSKQKTEEDLREELENMRDNVVDIGQELVEAKEKIKELQAEKVTLQEQVTKLEQEIEAIKTQSKSSEKLETEFKALTAEYEDLKIKYSTLQTDLGAAQALATSRYRDLSDLRDVLQKVQPELKTLRTENANMKATKEELMARTSELRRLEAREKDLKADVASFKKQAADRDAELKALNDKITQETNGRLRAEDQARIAQRDMRKLDAEKITLSASGEKASRELTEIQDEAGKLRTKVRDLEDQVSKLTTESTGLREEVQLRGSQYNNAQGLLGSMRDQTAEMAMQLKEAKEQSESLEEELGEVQRLLNERTREGETMRRLLADVDDRADAKVREMRERMEAAIEERDRAEDEASTNARRRAREVDELKTKIRDLDRDLKRAADDRDELQRSEKDWKRRRDELEVASEKASQEVNEIRSAISELRNTLDGSEKQARDAEKQKIDLRRLLDEANQRYEKLQKEFKSLQAKQSRLIESSSTSSLDSGRGASPVNGVAKMDYVYLKTVLLQFLEQRDKKRQADLVPVLGRLLHFDKKDEQKWVSAINSIK